jgi:tRNA(Ile)-lysidine synthase
VVETMLLNLSRGTGLRGLMGIRPVLKKIVRPLLFASRPEIIQYAEAHSLKWREDSSNLETKYLRNKIRHTIIPAFESINPSFIENAAETINRIEQTGKLLNLILSQIKQELWTELPGRIMINISKLKEYPANDLLLFELLRDFGISQLSEQMIFNSLESATGKQFHTRTHTFTHDRGYLIVTPKSTPDPCETAIEADTILLNYPLRLFFTTIEKTAGFKIPRQKNKVALDAGKITYPLVLRVWKSGDRFYPLGLQGSKKISDFLIDLKVPLPDKRHIWILECQGKIAWVVNHRIDDRFKVTEETRKILIIDYNE